MTEEKTVLIVEDEKNIVDILRFNLERKGYRVLEAYDGEDESIRRVFKAEDGYVLEVETAGYAAPMTLWVGVTNDGSVSGVTVRDHGETFGLGRGAQTDASFLLQFLHTSEEAAVGEDIDALTGATVTSKAVTRAVNSAAAFVTGADVSSGATEWEG